MRRSVIAIAFVAAAVLGATGASAQTERRGILSEIFGGLTRPSAAATSQRDAASALREALTNGVVAATTRLGHVDGFYRDGRVRIPLPGTLASAQRSLRPLGMAEPLDDLELRINRAAEAAMPQARTLIVDAVRSITFSDALSIVRGGDDAGTRYLRQRTETKLTELLRPHMQSALERSGAFTALDTAVSRSRLNAGAAVGRLRSDMIDFAVTKALDGAFAYVADEEKAIRTDPAKRTSDILRRVFGGG